VFKTTICPRLTLAEILPDHCHKVIYLDADVLVETDLSRLWRQEIEDYQLLAVRDYGNPSVSVGLRDTYQTLRLDGAAPYFNDGVMVLNLLRWRRDGTGDSAVEYLHRFDGLHRFPDQDALNAAAAGNVGWLDLRWNAQVAAIQTHSGWPASPFKEEIRPQLRELLAAPYIRHFVGPTKPWHRGYVVPGRKRFFSYLQSSGWFSRAGFLRWKSRWLSDSAWLMLRLAVQRRST
jgi:lipopolysaccharide biosynthesis glycosyltransferase